METLDRLIGDIVQASLEQNKGIGEISEAMNEINASSAQNSTVAHEASATALRMKEQVNLLENQIRSLQIFLRAVQNEESPQGKKPEEKVLPNELEWDEAA